MYEFDASNHTEIEAPGCCTFCGMPGSDVTEVAGHKQIHLSGYGQEADVDEGIAPLVLELWRCGIPTVVSCQEGARGYVWLQFLFPSLASFFMSVVAGYDPEPGSLYQRALGYSEGPGNWASSAEPVDLNLIEKYDGRDDTVEQSHAGEPYFLFAISVGFPPSDLPAVMKALAALPTDEAKGAHEPLCELLGQPLARA